MAACYRHPDRETGVSCSNCGRPICTDCMTPTPVGMRCPECARQKTQARTAASIRAGGEPRVTYALIALSVVAFLATGQFGVQAGNSSELFRRLALDGPDVSAGEYWRLVTGGFLHSGFLHIAFNMYLLYVLGRMFEDAIGPVRFGLLYLVSLLAGSAGALVVEPLAYTVGASGAVFGLMAAAFLEMRWRGLDPMAGGVFGSIGGLILINLVFSFVISGISIGGHIGGLIGGALVALAFHHADRARRPVLAYAGAAVVGAASVALAVAASGGQGL